MDLDFNNFFTVLGWIIEAFTIFMYTFFFINKNHPNTEWNQGSKTKFIKSCYISPRHWYIFLVLFFLRRLLTTAAMIIVNSSRWSLKSILTKEFSSTSCFGSSNNTFIFWCMRTKFLLAYNIIILCDKDPCP